MLDHHGLVFGAGGREIASSRLDCEAELLDGAGPVAQLMHGPVAPLLTDNEGIMFPMGGART